MSALSDTMPEVGSDNPTMVEVGQSYGPQLSTNAKELEISNNATKLLGLFAKSTLHTEWIGEDNRKAERLTTDDNGNAVYPAPFGCVANPKHKGIPTLSQMASSALITLSRNNDKGFFLMIEGASIDKQSHNRNPCSQIGELQAFDKTVALVRQFAAKNPNTLVIVTADHGQAGQIIPLPETYQLLGELFQQPQYSAGLTAVLKTLNGELLAVNYATNASPEGLMEMHTGTNVPAYMEGPGLEDVPILINQRIINQLMRNHLDAH